MGYMRGEFEFMHVEEKKVESLSRQRVHLGLAVALCYIVVLGGIAANDALVQAGRGAGGLRVAALAVIGVGGAVMLALLGRFVLLLLRSFREPRLKSTLWDELASANHRQSMVLAYLSMLIVLVALAVISMFRTLSAPWVVNGMLVTAFLVQAVAFAILERRGNA
jgi:hypothetical protein